MGLCKCPKRKVTNQFCFEHRVNVCEHCMVQKHPRCVVQSYLQWLQDSDYDPTCKFCSSDLTEGSAEVVRLTCYCVFRWSCLDKYARSLPENTAPAGYTCPKCDTCIFPDDNLASPVADALRQKLKEVNWARAGLGLPLLDDRSERRPQEPSLAPPAGPRPTPEGGGAVTHGTPKSYNEEVSVHHLHSDNASHHRANLMMEQQKQSNNNPAYQTLVTSPLLRGDDDRDNDENKYKRKSALEMLVRWAKASGFLGSSRRPSKIQRFTMIALLLFLVFVTFLVIMSYWSRGADYSDPMLEPMNNPNIHVGSK